MADRKKNLDYRVVIAIILLGLTWAEEKLPTNPYFQFKDSNRREVNWKLIENGSTHFISDERWFYYDRFKIDNVDDGLMGIYSEIGKGLEPFFKGLPAIVAIPGAMNMIAYYANFKTCINEYGLTDPYIAHLPLSNRGHVGHEKKAPEEYLQRRNVDFELTKAAIKLPERPDIDMISFEIPDIGMWELARLVTYNKPLMDSLSARFKEAGNHSRLPLFEQIIPEYMNKTLSSVSLYNVESAYDLFQRFYFRRYPDSSMERAFENRITELKQDSIVNHK